MKKIVVAGDEESGEILFSFVADNLTEKQLDLLPEKASELGYNLWIFDYDQTKGYRDAVNYMRAEFGKDPLGPRDWSPGE